MNYLLVSEGPITVSFLYMSRTSPAEILNTCLINKTVILYVNTFLTVKNALFLTNRGIDVCLMRFISRVKLKSWREKRWIWLKYYLLGQRSLSKRQAHIHVSFLFDCFIDERKFGKTFHVTFFAFINIYRETLLNNFEQKLK